MNYIIKTAPTVEPVSITEAQAQTHAITTDTTETALLTALITAAREYCEQYTRRALAPQTIELYLDYFPIEIKLPMPPITSVTSIKYKDYLGTELTLDASTYVLDTVEGEIVQAYGKTFPSFTAYVVNPITVTYATGYTAANIPKSIKQAILLLIGYWYINREAAGVEISRQIEFSVKNLLSMYRSGWF